MPTFCDQLSNITGSWTPLADFPIAAAVSDKLSGADAEQAWRAVHEQTEGSAVCVPPNWLRLHVDYDQVSLLPPDPTDDKDVWLGDLPQQVEQAAQMSFEEAYEALARRSVYAASDVQRLQKIVQSVEQPAASRARDIRPARVVAVDAASVDLPAWMSLEAIPGSATGQEHRAFLSRWKRRYGIRLLHCAAASIVLEVAAPPSTASELAELAAEHLLYCRDIPQMYTRTLEVDESPDQLDGWVEWFDASQFAADRASTRWAFWWD